MKRFFLTALVSLLAQGSPIQAQQTAFADHRTFTATDGRTLKATIVSKTENHVTIRRAEDGQEFLLPLERLSAADQAFVKAWSPAPAAWSWVIQPRFPVADLFRQRLALPYIQDAQGKWQQTVITADGRVLLDLDKGETTRQGIDKSVFLKEGAFPFLRGGKWGIMSTSGSVFAEPRWKDVGMEFGDTLAFADEATGKWGLVDAKGKIIVPAQFEKVYPFAGDYAPALQAADGKWGLVDRTGKLVHEHQWERLHPFDGRRYGSTRISSSSRELFWVSRAQKWCVFDAVAGKYVFESDALAEGPSPMVTGNFFQTSKGGRTGWWHVDGAALAEGDELVTNYTWGSTSVFIRDQSLVRDSTSFIRADLDRIVIRRGSKLGLADADGKVLGGVVWDKISNRGSMDHFIVEQGGKVGIISRDGAILEPAQWPNEMPLLDALFITNMSLVPTGKVVALLQGPSNNEPGDALFIQAGDKIVRVIGDNAANRTFIPEENGERHAVSNGLTFVLKPEVARVFGPAYNGLLPVEMWGVACAIRPSGEVAFPPQVVEPEKRAVLGADYGPFYMGELVGFPGGWVLSGYETRKKQIRLLNSSGAVVSEAEFEDVMLPEDGFPDPSKPAVFFAQKDGLWGCLRISSVSK
ncbi:MAG: WG repeat-containing protein [Verrucomicrobiaceae bacterium]|nr:WG repeat-containing protein [Verrucomicrobiaceae bacterium]